jgi:glycosyltransferase involved in cell wall biosynthesis
MPRLPLSVTIITLNEEKNIRRAIQSVHWADEVLVVDSGSTDKTVEIAKSLGARVIFHAWPGYGQQKNFAQQQAAYHWVLNLDADEAVSEVLALEIQEALLKVQSEQITAKGFYFPRKTYYLGQWIKHGGWYPNHLVRLIDRNYASWTEPNVHEELKVRGEIVGLTQPIDHYAFTSIMDQILTNLKFSKLGSLELERKGQQPSLFRLLMKPVGKFLETYLLKRGFLDGLAGFIISVNAAHSMFLKYAYLYEGRIRKDRTEERSETNENINC